MSTITSTDRLRAAIAPGSSLSTALRAGLALDPAWSVVDVIIQDEFTHDVVMQAAPDGPVLVLDCT